MDSPAAIANNTMFAERSMVFVIKAFGGAMKKYCIALIASIFAFLLVSSCAAPPVALNPPPVEGTTTPAPAPEYTPSPAREPLYTFVDSAVQAAVERLLDKSEELSQEDLDALRTVRSLSVQSY